MKFQSSLTLLINALIIEEYSEADQLCLIQFLSSTFGKSIKRSKSRNLLERLRDFETDVLRFTVSKEVPFTNNQGENDIRMTKVHQKISGCFRSQEGAAMFCRIRSFLSTCRKQNVSATEGLSLLY